MASDAAGVEPLPVLAAAAVPSEGARCAWLVEGLWSAQGVGVIGGAPKCGRLFSKACVPILDLREHAGQDLEAQVLLVS